MTTNLFLFQSHPAAGGRVNMLLSVFGPSKFPIGEFRAYSLFVFQAGPVFTQIIWMNWLAQ